MKPIVVLAVLLLIIVPVVGQSQDSEGFPLTVTDKSGVEITLAAPVEDILCLSIACIDHLHQLGLQPAGITDLLALPFEQYFGEIDEDMTIISGGMQPDIEQIAAMGPDLIIGQAGFFDALREAFSSIAPLFLIYPTTVEDTISEVETMGLMTGRSDEAEAAAETFLERFEAYHEDVPGDLTMMIVFGAAQGDNMFLEAANGQTCLMLEAIASCPFTVPEDATGMAAFGYSNFTFESILVADPDVIFFSGYNEDRSLNEEAIEALEANELWQELSAVQNERVYLIEPWVWRGGRGLTLMARTLDEAMPALYPDVFPEPLAFETDTDETSEDDTETDE